MLDVAGVPSLFDCLIICWTLPQIRLSTTNATQACGSAHAVLVQPFLPSRCKESLGVRGSGNEDVVDVTVTKHIESDLRWTHRLSSLVVARGTAREERHFHFE